MSYQTQQIEEQAKRVRAALVDLHQQIQRDIPPGTLVDYLHGENWVGPCELVKWTGYWWTNTDGPRARLINKKTGKRTEVTSYRRLRPSRMLNTLHQVTNHART
ncbi:hypothetical protein ACLUEY_01145 [Vreelandella aquamarina]